MTPVPSHILLMYSWRIAFPLDKVSSAALAYSTRRLSSAYTGKALRVRRSSDNAEQDIGFIDNELDTPDVETFAGAGDAFVVTWYDQSGNTRNLTQATAVKQPKIVSSGSIITRNTKPTILFDGTDDVLATGTIAALNQPETWFLAMTQITWTANDRIFDGDTDNVMRFLQSGTTPTVVLSSGVTLTASPDPALGTMDLMSSVLNGVSSSIRTNGSAEVTGDAGENDADGFTLGDRPTGSRAANVEVSEFLFYLSGLSAVDQTTVRDNINTFFSIY